MSNDRWIENLKTQSRRLKNLKSNPRIDLVNGLPWVRIRDIADQFYCEKKVDLELRLGKKYFKDLKDGSEVHSKVDSELVRVSLKKLIEEIVSKKPLITKLAVDFEIDGVPIFGRSDQIFFRDAKPCYLFELKSTNYNLDRIYKGEKVQALLYGFGLDKMGFDCSRLCLAVVKVRRDLKSEYYQKLTKNVIKLLDSMYSTKERILSDCIKLEGCYIHLWNYSGISELEAELRDKLSYWTKKRSPAKAKNPTKCKSCVYRKECLQSNF